MKHKLLIKNRKYGRTTLFVFLFFLVVIPFNFAYVHDLEPMLTIAIQFTEAVIFVKIIDLSYFFNIEIKEIELEFPSLTVTCGSLTAPHNEERRKNK